MLVIMPYVGLPDPQVVEVLDDSGHDFTPIDVGCCDRGYFNTLSAFWDLGETFTVVEHDIVVHPGALDELADCDCDWCGYPFEYEGAWTLGLGCAKFSAALIERNPDALLRVGVMSDPTHPKRHWCRLDAWLTSVLMSGDEERHAHTPAVQHLNPYSTHGCIHST